MTLVLLFLAAALTLVPSLVDAQTYRLAEPDGTMHYTNAPTDPRYQRSGLAPGTQPRPPALAAAAPAPTSFSVSESIAGYIRDAAARHGVPAELVHAVIRVESGGNPRAVSRKGARGLMQLMPATASMLGVRDSFDPAENIEGGVRHLRGLLDRLGNNLPLVLAAYNAGEGAVSQYRGIPPYAETQDYVAKIMRMVGEPLTAAGAPAAPPAPERTYQFTDEEGSTVYTNIPPRGRK